MAAFFAKTWGLWYAFAVILIMRWFRVAAGDVQWETQIHRADIMQARRNDNRLNPWSLAGQPSSKPNS
jgi:hypothetical protein